MTVFISCILGSHVMNRVVTRPPRFRSEQWRHGFFFNVNQRSRRIGNSCRRVYEFYFLFLMLYQRLQVQYICISPRPGLTFLFFSSDQCSFLRLNEDLSPQGVDRWSWNLFLLFSHSTVHFGEHIHEMGVAMKFSDDLLMTSLSFDTHVYHFWLHEAYRWTSLIL